MATRTDIQKLNKNVFNTAANQDIRVLTEMLEKIVDITDIADIAGTNLTAVPASFADLAAVKTYLDSVIPEIETRLDDIEAKINAILAV